MLTMGPQRFPARREESKACRRGQEGIDEIGDFVEEMLAVVEDEKYIPTGEVRRQAADTGPRQAHAHRLCHGIDDRVAVRHRRKTDREHAVGGPLRQLRSDREGEARLPAAPDPGEGHQSRAVKLRSDAGNIGIASDQTRLLDGKVVVGDVERAKRWKGGTHARGVQLQDRLGLEEILKPMSAELDEGQFGG